MDSLEMIFMTVRSLFYIRLPKKYYFHTYKNKCRLWAFLFTVLRNTCLYCLAFRTRFKCDKFKGEFDLTLTFVK